MIFSKVHFDCIASHSFKILNDTQALLIALTTFSGVEGAARWKVLLNPLSSLADRTAVLIAKKTETPLRNGGSPTPLEE